eukprot:5756547-Heterocapsa_arctica.AAC.1
MGCRLCCHRQPLEQAIELPAVLATPEPSTEGCVIPKTQSGRHRINRTPDWILAHWATLEEERA